MAFLVGGQLIWPYFMVSVAIGRPFVGLPVVLPLPSSLISQIPWPVVLVAGCCPGPLALAFILVTSAAVQALMGPGPARLSFDGCLSAPNPYGQCPVWFQPVSTTTWALVRGKYCNSFH